MKLSRKTLALALVLCAALSGCGKEEEPVTAPLDPDNVYWTPMNQYYHSTPDCPAIRSAKGVRSTPLEDAELNQKTEPCPQCVEQE